MSRDRVDLYACDSSNLKPACNCLLREPFDSLARHFDLSLGFTQDAFANKYCLSMKNVILNAAEDKDDEMAQDGATNLKQER